MANIESGQADEFLVLQYKKLKAKAVRAMPGNDSLEFDIERDKSMDALIATITATMYQTEPQLRTTKAESGKRLFYVNTVWDQIKVWLSRYRVFRFLKGRINWETFETKILVQHFVEHTYPNLALWTTARDKDGTLRLLCNHQGFYTEEDIRKAWAKTDMPLSNLVLWDTFRKELRKLRLGGNGEN